MNLTRKEYTEAAPLPCRSYIVTLIHGSERIVRHIIAHSTMQAVSIGIAMLPDTAGPVSLFCKPAERRFHEHPNL